jgi:hypothetical protein
MNAVLKEVTANRPGRGGPLINPFHSSAGWQMGKRAGLGDSRAKEKADGL